MSRDIRKFLDILGENLLGIGINSFFLSLYEDLERADIRDSNSRLIFAYKNRKPCPLNSTGVIYPTRELLPPGMFDPGERVVYSVEPLFFRSRQFGFAVFELSEYEDFVTNIIRRAFVTNALRNILFIQQLQDQTMKVQQLNIELEYRVHRRTEELNNTNQELKETLKELRLTQQELVESEKMAALGNLVAGVAHEINTPVGISVTAASHLEGKTDEIIQLFEEGKMKKSDLYAYLSSTREAMRLLLNNLKWASRLIRSFKEISVDQSSEERRWFNIRRYIDDILLSLKSKLKKVNHEIRVNCPESLVWDSYPGAFSQILTNLIMNSLIHAYGEDDEGTIIFEVEKNHQRLFLTYRDDGRGIEESHLKKIFNPFFTTLRRKGGTGLGLHLVYNLVTQTFGGKIKCKSAIGEGTAFFITLPVDGVREDGGS